MGEPRVVGQEVGREGNLRRSLNQLRYSPPHALNFNFVGFETNHDMVSYSNILKFLSKPVYRCSLSQRVYYSARAAPARSTDGPTPRRQKRVSKKAFDELPTALTDPFGRAVAPLGEYEDSYNPIPRAKRSKRKNLEGEICPFQEPLIQTKSSSLARFKHLPRD
jgi:hypothetical protein